MAAHHPQQSAKCRHDRQKHRLAFDCVISRETCAPKPHPQSLHIACEALETHKDNAWMVGDGRCDIEAGLAAGMRTVWISHGQTARSLQPRGGRCVICMRCTPISRM